MFEDDFPKTFEVPPGGADAAGLEDYGVELRGGERLGTIVDCVAEGDRRWLVVETGLPPLKRDRRAIPWSEIQEVDHDALLVTVAASTAETFPRLPEAGREDEAPARRVTESPDAPRYVPTGDVAGPTDGTRFFSEPWRRSRSACSRCSRSSVFSAGGAITNWSGLPWRSLLSSCSPRAFSAIGCGATPTHVNVEPRLHHGPSHASTRSRLTQTVERRLRVTRGVCAELHRSRSAMSGVETHGDPPVSVRILDPSDGLERCASVRVPITSPALRRTN